MREKFPFNRLLLAALPFVLVMALVVVFGPIQAAPAAPAAPSDWTVVASGLGNPRGITFGPDGAMYVAESGSGGDGTCIPGPEGEDVCYGASGAVTRVTWDSNRAATEQEQVVTGLPSLGAPTTGDAASGPNAVAFDSEGEMYVLTGLGGPPTLQDPSGPLGADGANFGWIMSADPVADSFTPWVNIAQYEADSNPEDSAVDTNPFDMIKTDTGFQVTDAGGNDLLAVADDGTISTTAVFPPRMVEFPPGTGNMMPMDAVPTAVKIGPDGAYYVSQLTGFPFPVGGANIWRVEPGSDPEIYLSGFSSILDFDFAIDGSVYVLEMFANGQLSGDPNGAIIHVAPDGYRTTVVNQGLITPTAMTIGPDLALYVANFGASGSMGQVVRIPTELSEATEFAAFLTEDQEVSNVARTAADMDAWGRATFTLDGDTLSYTVWVWDIDDITASHIHLGARGENGPVVFPLYTGTGDFGPGHPISGDLMLTPEQVMQLKAGLYYVNVHTTDFPAGEIRGQIGVARAPLYLPAVAAQ